MLKIIFFILLPFSALSQTFCSLELKTNSGDVKLNESYIRRDNQPVYRVEKTLNLYASNWQLDQCIWLTRNKLYQVEFYMGERYLRIFRLKDGDLIETLKIYKLKLNFTKDDKI